MMSKQDIDVTMAVAAADIIRRGPDDRDILKYLLKLLICQASDASATFKPKIVGGDPHSPSPPFPFPFPHPFVPLLPFPSFGPPLPSGRFSCLPCISLLSPPLPLEVGPLNPARGPGDRCKLPPSGVWAENSNLVHFSFKIWHQAAAILMIFMRYNLPQFVQFKQY